ncbi:MAG: ArnT family glycosyltransferase [Candidatus Dormibacteria bacterium]
MPPSLILPLAFLVLLRLPSLFEPHWYTDEAGYANTAYLMAHGKVLYLTVWNNKPPLLFWIYQLALGGFGPSEFGLHLLSLVSEAAALAGVWRLGRAQLSSRGVWLATAMGALLLGIPLFDGDLALPENFLIAFTVWAMVVALASLSSEGARRAAVLAALAGVLLGLACLIQQTALADAAAACLFLLLARRRRPWLAAVVAGALTLAVVIALAPFLLRAGVGNVFFFLVGSYFGYAGRSLAANAADLIPRGLAIALLLFGVWRSRGWDSVSRLSLIWLAAVLLAYTLPNRPYLHFLLPAVPPAALCLARWSGLATFRRWPRLWPGARPLVVSVVISGGLWAVLLLGAAGTGSLFPGKLTAEYYPAFIARATGLISSSALDRVFGTGPAAEGSAVAWIRVHRLSGSRAVVWSPDSWAYLLGDLHPVLPAAAIYVDQEWLGSDGLLARLEQAKPALILVTGKSPDQFGPIVPVLRAAYTEVDRVAGAQLWIRDAVALRLGRLERAHDQSGRSRVQVRTGANAGG